MSGGIFLPNTINYPRLFECKECGIRFQKQTPSQVEKCIKCKGLVFQFGVKESELNPYSLTKLRWYRDRTGEYHRDEIKRRSTETIEGKKHVVIKDDNGKKIGYLPNIQVSGDIGKKSAVKT